MSIEKITFDGKTLAILVKINEINDNLKFFSPESFPMQVGVHNKPEGFCIAAHDHRSFEKLENFPVQEIFYVLSGKIEVGLYHKNKRVENRILNQGELIIINTAHDLKFLSNSKMMEIKQGPYRGKENEKKFLDIK